MDEKRIEDAKAFIEKLFEGNADGHDASHSLRVYHNARKIASSHPKANLEVICLASLLHDADDHKLFQTENNANARAFLEEEGVPSEEMERICLAINEVSWSQNQGKKPSSLEAEIVQDADRLDALGAIGIARTFAYGGRKGRSLDASIAHFHEKLLLLKDHMNTEEGKRIAETRHAYLLSYLEELREELGE